jgi:glycosyltransferase involved in cell wall biosynthesis
LVSTIIPAFNASEYIAESISSALAQSHSRIEVIVVDDGSTDDTLNKCAAFGDKITIIRQTNRGPAAARNSGARIARGDWLAFLDADDRWLPEKIEMQLRHIGSTSCGYTDRVNIGELGALSSIQSEGVALHHGEVFRQLLLDGNFITLSSVIIRKSLFADLHGFDERPSFIGVEDWELWLRVSNHTKVSLVPEPLVRYRCHNTGLSKNVAAMHAAQDAVLRSLENRVDRRTMRFARARSAAISAWFAQNGNDFLMASQLYLKSLLLMPFCKETQKGMLKCLLRRR